MAQVTVRINGYAYTVGCEDGQEAHLQNMAAQVENRINSIKAIGGQSGESRLLVLAALLMADELHDLQGEMASLRSASPSATGESASPAAAEAQRRLKRLADRAEEIAADLEHP